MPFRSDGGIGIVGSRKIQEAWLTSQPGYIARATISPGIETGSMDWTVHGVLVAPLIDDLSHTKFRPVKGSRIGLTPIKNNGDSTTADWGNPLVLPGGWKVF